MAPASVQELLLRIRGDSQSGQEALSSIATEMRKTEAEAGRLAAELKKTGEAMPATFKAVTEQMLGDATAKAALLRQQFNAIKKVLAPDNQPSFVQQFASDVASTAAGVITAQAVIATFKGAVSLLAHELVTLTTHGAAVGDVANNFDHMTASAGRLGETLMGALREGTHATVDDFQLMQLANQDLAVGLNLTDQQFKTLATGAFALSQATGVDVKTALDTMNDAMLTGRTRAVAMLTGKIDLEAAEAKYARSIGTTADHLTEEGKLEAARMAILDGVAAATGRLGEQTDGLDEIIAQARTAWANFQNELGKTVATSPVLVSGFEGIRDILRKVFGPDQAAAVKAIATQIDGAALAVVDLADAGVQAGGFLRKEWIAVEKLFGDVRQAIDFAQLGTQVAAYATGAGLYTPGMKDSIHELIVGIERRGRSLQALDAIQAGVDGHTKEHIATIQGLREKMQDAAAAQAAFVGPLKETAGAQQGAAAGATDHGKAVKQTAEEIKKAATAWAKSIRDLASDQAWLEKASNDTFKRIRKMYDDQVAVAKSGMERSNAEVVKGLQIAFAARTNADDLIAKQTLSATDYQVFQIEREFTEKQQALRSSLGDSQAYYRALNDLADERMAKLNALVDAEWEASHQMIPPDELSRRTKEGTDGIHDLSQAFSQLAQISGGKFGGIVQGIGQMVGAVGLAHTAMVNLGKAGLTTAASLANAVSVAAAFYMGGRAIQGWLESTGWFSRENTDRINAFLTTAQQLAVALQSAGGGDAVAGVAALVEAFQQAGLSADVARAHVRDLMAEIYGDGAGAAAAVREISDALDHLRTVQAGASAFGLGRDQLVEAEKAAHEIFDYMAQSGQYTADQIEAAYYAWQKAMADAGNEAAAAWVAAHGMAQSALPDFAQLQGVAERYGITLAGLGPKFEQGRLTAEAKKVFDDFTALKDAGGDVGGILSGMSDEISDLVNESMKFGTVLPANMKPLIENLIAAGRLTDDAGKKITDISGIKFEDTPLAEGIKEGADGFSGYGSKARDARAAIENEFRDFAIRIPVHFLRDDGDPVRAHGGALVHAGWLQHFHEGTPRISGLGRDEMLAVLQDGEAVLRRQAVDALGPETIAMLNRATRGHSAGAYAAAFNASPLPSFAPPAAGQAAAGGGAPATVVNIGTHIAHVSAVDVDSFRRLMTQQDGGVDALISNLDRNDQGRRTAIRDVLGI